ncbi:hypothetical protein LTR08_003944 [Meristemomyces frigidus]|nr:hypothetical protein LTR08_003944 [Meristemomyces frigidus]
MSTGAGQPVKLVSSDNVEIVTKRKIAERSMLIKNMIGDLGAPGEEPIQITNVSEAILRKVLEWCTHHRNDPTTTQDDDADSRKKTTDIEDWDQKFMQVDQKMLFEIILAADYMDIEALLDVGCKTVANMIMGKSPKEILKTFNIQNDFTTMFITNYAIRTNMMEVLTATDLATFCYSLKISLTDQETDKYLIPIRDLPEQVEWIRSRVRDGDTVNIVGRNLPLLYTRMRDPDRYWIEGRRRHTIIRLWIVATPTKKSRDEDLAKVRELFDLLSRAWMESRDRDLMEIDCWNTLGPMDWTNMTSEDKRLLMEWHLLTDLKLVRPPSERGTFVEVTDEPIIRAIYLRTDKGESKWHMLSGPNNFPIEVMYLETTFSRRMTVDWVPNHLIDQHNTKLTTSILTVAKDGTLCEERSLNPEPQLVINNTDKYEMNILTSIENNWLTHTLVIRS